MISLQLDEAGHISRKNIKECKTFVMNVDPDWGKVDREIISKCLVIHLDFV